MHEREINAFYEDGAIYVTNEQDDEMDMIEDIIHELSHAIEQKNGASIYGDSNLEREFRAKRQRLEALLRQNYDVPADFSITLDYDKNIDMFLYKTVDICRAPAGALQISIVNIGQKVLKRFSWAIKIS